MEIAIFHAIIWRTVRVTADFLNIGKKSVKRVYEQTMISHFRQMMNMLIWKSIKNWVNTQIIIEIKVWVFEKSYFWKLTVTLRTGSKFQTKFGRPDGTIMIVERTVTNQSNLMMLGLTNWLSLILLTPAGMFEDMLTIKICQLRWERFFFVQIWHRNKFNPRTTETVTKW